ncbi:MAG: type II and III secretion system protein family protein [Proteobacteria bacterium]|nr:type II and III secretion system protein family protein [Pseudomonadota bacterium]
MKRPGLLAGLLAVALLLPAIGAGTAFAQTGAPAYGGVSRTVAVPVNKSAAFRLDGPVGEVVVAQPEIAQIVATTDQSFYVRGKALGGTNILVYNRGRDLVEVIDVVVGHDSSAIEADIAAALPGEKVAVRSVGKGVLLSGSVATASQAARVRSIAERYVPAADITAALAVRGSEQVMLEVRVIEASRNSLKELGIDVQLANLSGFIFASGAGVLSGTPQSVASIATNSGTTNIDVLISALEEKGVLRTLARPNLTALSGEPASFLAGGEFPVPVAVTRGEDGARDLGIEFKPFGVKLEFTPLVSEGGLIRLKVAPEVSQLDSRQGVRIQGVEIPGLSVRRATTTVELREGQSFAVAGLFQQEYSNAVRQLPFLGDIPVLGALFRSARWRRAETELVIVVTPRVVAPTDSPTGGLRDPLASTVDPSQAAIFLKGRALDKRLAPTTGGAR